MAISTLPDREPSLLLPNRGGAHYEDGTISIDLHPPGCCEYYFISPKEAIGFPVGQKPSRIVRAFDSDTLTSEYLMPDTMGITLLGSQTYARVCENQDDRGELLEMYYDPSLREAIEREMPKRRAVLRSDHNLPLTHSSKMLFQSILNFTTNGFQGGKLVAESLVTLAIVHALETFDKNLRKKTTLSPVLKKEALNRTLEFIEANLDRNIGLREISDIAAVSLYHLSQCFKDAVGETPHAYLVKRRVERAKEMLARTPKPLSEIARACGFSSQSHLSTAFKHSTGVTPSYYRREVQR